MFKRILIANRGEIACRIMKTARRMGIATVGVYSDADRDALHVEMADEAVAIGPAAAAQSYLSIEKIIAACRSTGAQAVHPGYGFLSERADFARALEAAGIVFVGPNADAIAAMGDKIESKRAAAAAGVSTVPGHLGVIADAKEAVIIAEEIGYPVMIKASAGGGGKGMRIASTRAEVTEGFERARSEARSSFGDDRLFIEKFITDPRHVEIQVLGDKHGHVIALGERECSIQRRNQKVIEEAPSPLLDEATRRKMSDQAVALARAVGYDSAGTVEFVAGQDRSFYFLEMNTRLQVEHPVTELVTGIDLVEQMLRVAAGETLALKQDDVQLRGWAVESRVYAEDPQRNFLPSTGRLTTYREPRVGQGASRGATVRNDTGVREGSDVSIFYDPLLSKLVTHASTREEAVTAQALALDSFAIRGIRHNLSFLAAVMRHPRWRSGQLSTAFIAEEFPDGFMHREPDAVATRTLLAIAATLADKLDARRRRAAGRRVVRLGHHDYPVAVTRNNAQAVVVLTDEHGEPGRTLHVVSDWKPGDPVFSGTIDGEAVAARVDRVTNGFALAHAGFETTAFVYSEIEARAARMMPEVTLGARDKAVRCPMPGLVMSIAVHEGQPVKAGEMLAVVEAMKMENVLRADHDGTIGAIRVKPGDVLAVDAVILEFS